MRVDLIQEHLYPRTPRKPKIEPCACCGGEAYLCGGNFWACRECEVEGPTKDLTGEKWNQLMRAARERDLLLRFMNALVKDDMIRWERSRYNQISVTLCSEATYQRRLARWLLKELEGEGKCETTPNDKR